MLTSLAILPRRIRQACREGSPVGMMLIGCRQGVTSIDHHIGVRKQLCWHINTLRFSGLQTANDFVPRHR